MQIDRIADTSHATSRAVGSPGLAIWSPCKATVLASIAAFVVQLDGSALNVALPTIGSLFGASLSELQRIVDAYTLAYSCPLLSAGAASDRFGARRVRQTVPEIIATGLRGRAHNHCTWGSLHLGA